MKGIAAAIHWLAEKILAFTTEEGGRQIAWAAICGEGDLNALRGAYMVATRVEEPADFLLGKREKERGAKLWVSSPPSPESTCWPNCFWVMAPQADLVRELSKVDGRVADIVGQYS